MKLDTPTCTDRIYTRAVIEEALQNYTPQYIGIVRHKPAAWPRTSYSDSEYVGYVRQIFIDGNELKIDFVFLATPEGDWIRSVEESGIALRFIPSFVGRLEKDGNYWLVSQLEFVGIYVISFIERIEFEFDIELSTEVRLTGLGQHPLKV